MYITGNKFDLEVRVHEFPRNSGDLNMYLLEYLNYSNVSTDIKNKLNSEHNKKLLSLHGVVDISKHYS